MTIARKQKARRIVVALSATPSCPLTIGKMALVVSRLSPKGIAIAAIEVTRLVTSARLALVVVGRRTRT